MGKISNGAFSNYEDLDEVEEDRELLGNQQTGEKKNCIRFRISPSVSVKQNGDNTANERVIIHL